MLHLDVDGDGVVTRDEIYNALSKDSKDFKNNQIVPRVNFDALLKRIRQGADKFRSLEDFVRVLFNNIDTNKNTSISFTELYAGLSQLGIQISEREKLELMKKLDKD